MEKYIKEFEVGDVIKPFELALAREDGQGIFHNSSYGGSYLQKEIQPFQIVISGDEHPEDTISVKTMSLANFINQNKIKQVDILKIDVESSEHEIFNAPDFPSVADKIKMIIGEHGDGLREILEPLGFKYKEYKYGYIYTR